MQALLSQERVVNLSEGLTLNKWLNVHILWLYVEKMQLFVLSLDPPSALKHILSLLIICAY